MPSKNTKNKLKSFGKNRREIRPPTEYDENGDWISHQHHDVLRTTENELFTRYYRDLQKIVSHPNVLTSTTWEAEMELFRTPLDTTIWINDTDPLAPKVRAHLESFPETLVQPIPWYPIKGMGWRILADKTSFRKRPEMSSLREFLIQQTALGTISRQEEVSMIPPFLLDIRQSDKCLDMCASPGSKTAQMLVALARHKIVPFESDASPFPFDYASEGLVMANELDTKRANMLVHQVKRLRLLFPFALFTNHDARYFPDIWLSSSENEKSETKTASSPLRFDKILCDVVCSGDGTLRKAPHIFKIWTPKEAFKLQKLQIHIALRACHLLTIGGRLVYSTCSINPIENEAVVAQIIHRTKGAMKLVDASALLPSLAFSKGMTTWTVTDAKGSVISSPSEDAHEALFPPHTSGGYNSSAVDVMDLSLCMRFLPSHCNGGAFFVAVLEKVSEFQIISRDPRKEMEPSDTAQAMDAVSPQIDQAASKYTVKKKVESIKDDDEKEKIKKNAQLSSDSRPEIADTNVDAISDQRERSMPPQYASAPPEITQTLREFYEITNFPNQYLVVRTANGERNLQLSKSSICSIVAKSARTILKEKNDTLRVVSAGLRLLAPENLNRGWRISQESALLFPKLMHHSSRLIRNVPLSFIESIVRKGGKLKEVLFEDIPEGELRSNMEKLSLGTVLLEVISPFAVNGKFHTVALRARSRLQLLVDHEDLVGVLMRLGLNTNDEKNTPA